MKPLLLVYITAKDRTLARGIGKTLVTERLAACANVIPAMESFYLWEGNLCDDAEALLIVKTRKALLEKLIRRVTAIHTYTVPCIVALPVVGGNPDFLGWITSETKKIPEKRTSGQKRKKRPDGKRQHR
ncbi:MAG: divalent-cation tolerance protein CutA [Chitinispirillaceae bacterium]|nr:divalent-cation tolerance protein CutA [Chitinispirillaceae bacterium]